MFLKNVTRGIGSKLLKQICYDDQVIGKINIESLSHIVAEPRVKYESLGFGDIEGKTMTMKITFVREKDEAHLAFSS